MDIQPGNVLVAPLNWGLGHATRCVPIIRQLVAEGRTVILASNGAALAFLRTEFLELPTVYLPGVDMRYSRSDSQILAMLCRLPHIIRASYREHQTAKDIVRRWNVKTVISDNRFGLFGIKAHSIYITHQLMIKMPRGLRWAEGIAHWLHGRLIKRYDECWIPDSPTLRLAGDMAHRYPIPENARFIGPLSRFDGTPDSDSAIHHLATIGLPAEVDFFIPASGPEPHRSKLVDDMRRRFAGTTQRVLILRGEPAPEVKVEHEENITMASHLPDHLFRYYLHENHSRRIICRSGYSTVMDLAAMNRTAVLIPTPGQPEQEYLARYSLLNEKQI